jgi:hypothetical protein
MGLWKPLTWPLRLDSGPSALCRNKYWLRRRSLGTLAQKDLIYIEFENLILGKILLNLKSEQYFCQLGVNVFSLLRRKLRATCMVIVLAPPSLRPQRSGWRARHEPHRRNPRPVLVKPFVFGSQNRLLHGYGHFVDLDDGAPLFPKFSEQDVVR